MSLPDETRHLKVIGSPSNDNHFTKLAKRPNRRSFISISKSIDLRTLSSHSPNPSAKSSIHPNLRPLSSISTFKSQPTNQKPRTCLAISIKHSSHTITTTQRPRNDATQHRHRRHHHRPLRPLDAARFPHLVDSERIPSSWRWWQLYR